MSANDSSGQIVLDSQIKQHTPAEKQADNLHAQDIREAQGTAIQQGCAQVGEMEATMEVEQAAQEGNKVKPVRPKQSVCQGRPTNISVTLHADEGSSIMDQSINSGVDMEVNTHHVDTNLTGCPLDIWGEKTPLSGGNRHALRRQNALTLYWLNLIWNLSMPKRRAFLLGRVNNWANEVQPSTSNVTPQNSTASDSQTGGKSHPPSSTMPSLTTKATSVSSAISDAAPAYRRTPIPVLNTSLDDENNDGMHESTPLPVWIAGHHMPKMVGHTTSTNANLQESDDDFDQPILKQPGQVLSASIQATTIPSILNISHLRLMKQMMKGPILTTTM
ncbi:hypothetical protein BKA83DRAFT_4133609 [Pisolithus microcarpus]|nr:hypothetical protein BKA83DRAFT_4133609 [Pisolithus microcarpus]